MKYNKRSWKFGTLTLMSFFGFVSLTAFAQPSLILANEFAVPEFRTIWARTDQQVLEGTVSRSYLWGSEPFTEGLEEDYLQSPAGKRLVQYFDKGRLEINSPEEGKSNPDYVTAGLLTRELISGRVQVGLNLFVERGAANIPIAGDLNDTEGPTYKAFSKLTNPVSATGNTVIVGSVNREGETRFDVNDFGKKYGVVSAYFEPITGHNIAAPFWNFLNQTTLVRNAQGSDITGRLFEPVYYVTGLPITEAWWTRVSVGGEMKDVLIQAFERRVLTFTPSNISQFQVEMGNVGRHYYLWRYSPQDIPTVFEDELNDFSKVSSHTSEVALDTQNSIFFGEDNSRARRNSPTEQEIAWKTAGIKTFKAVAYFWPNEAVSPFSFFTSADGENWAEALPEITGGEGNWQKFIYTLSNLKEVNFVKMRWNNLEGMYWNPQIGKVTIIS